MLATMSQAHAEWHRNTGVPMGTPGCPQDACHLPDEGPYDEVTHQVQTSYGLVDCHSFAEAKRVAREAAMATGHRTVIKPVQEA